MKFKRKALAIAVMVATTTLTACGSSSSDPKPKPDPTTPTNSAPTTVALSANTVDENVTGIEIGTLSATDADSGDTFTYAVDNDAFVIVEDKLSVVKGLDFEAGATVDLKVTVTDNGGLSHTQDLTVNVNDLLDYDFNSKIVDGEKSVAYSGQIARHALIAEFYSLHR